MQRHAARVFAGGRVNAQLNGAGGARDLYLAMQKSSGACSAAFHLTIAVGRVGKRHATNDTGAIQPIVLNAYLKESNPMGAVQQAADPCMDVNQSDHITRRVKACAFATLVPKGILYQAVITPEHPRLCVADTARGTQDVPIYLQTLCACAYPAVSDHNRKNRDGQPNGARNQSVTFCSPDGNKRGRRFVLWVSKPVRPR